MKERVCCVARYYKVMKCKEEDLGTASSRHDRKEKHIQSMFGNLQERTAWKRQMWMGRIC